MTPDPQPTVFELAAKSAEGQALRGAFPFLPPAGKRLRKSKTFWLNLGAVAVAAIGFVIDAAGIYHLSAATVETLLIVVGVLNAILRLYTNRPIAGSPGETALIADAAGGRPPAGVPT